MSWDVCVIKLKGPSPARVGEVREENVVALGTAAEVRGAISAYLAGADWCHRDGGIFDSGDRLPLPKDVQVQRIHRIPALQ